MHTLFESYEPAGHGVHSVLPSSGATNPGVHGRQPPNDWSELEGRYVCGLHGVHWPSCHDRPPKH
ncbi:MAG: hypothetical protein P4L99_22950 [Chthoniobacter sp.]|nr:hypothetical protein [Chthoniobacter sp.]